ncbi:hypothetical protein VNO78_19583 [Psophocarpus tetragonolobus]|uniref:Uncharacterized protein n=1 Tax=Psophocarpus tetragonolobus TaxID=3891 RepID=A0AAN9S8V7_PSOTE
MEMNNSTSQDMVIHYDQSEGDYDDCDMDDSYYLHFVNVILGGAARLNVLLPAVSTLAFSSFVPILTNGGECSTLNHWSMGIFLAILALCSFFLTFTDSFKTASGKLYYGVATIRGIWTCYGARKKPCVPSDYRLTWTDIFHASLSLLSFIAFAGVHQDVVKCYYPGLPRKVTNTLTLMICFLVSFFIVFPSKRRGIGYPFLMQPDPVYFRH